MKNLLQNKNSIKNFMYSLWVLSFVALGWVIAYFSTSSQEWTLSKFTQPSQVTTKTVSTLWTPSTDNPHRMKMQTYGHAARTDAIIVTMLKKGVLLDKDSFSVYLRNLQIGITAMANEPAFKSDPEIQEIAQYIAYEVTDTTNVLNGRDAFFQRLNDLISTAQTTSLTGVITTATGSSVVVATSTGGTTATGTTVAGRETSNTLSSTTPTSEATTGNAFAEIAALIQGINPTIVTTTTTATGTTTTTSGTGTGNVSDALLNDLATLINGLNTGTGTNTQNINEDLSVWLGMIAYDSYETFIKTLPQLNMVAAAMITSGVWPQPTFTAYKEKSPSVTERLLVDTANSNISLMLADSDGELAKRGIKPTQAQVDSYIQNHGINWKIVTVAEKYPPSNVSGSTGVEALLGDLIQLLNG
jgi:hypothetical protein